MAGLETSQFSHLRSKHCPEEQKFSSARSSAPPLETNTPQIWGVKISPLKFRECQCSFVYPHPSVSDLAGGNLDHGPRKTRTKTQTPPDSVFTLVGKCSATRCSVAAPPPGARQGFRGFMHPRRFPQWQRERCDRGLLRGCSCDTPATHSELRNEPRQGCSYTVERDRGGGGGSVCPTNRKWPRSLFLPVQARSCKEPSGAGWDQDGPGWPPPRDLDGSETL